MQIPAFTRSGQALQPVRERRAKSAIRQGQAVLIGATLAEGIRYKLPTDAEIATRQHEIGYDHTDARGRKWHGVQPAASHFRRCQVAVMQFS